ncbi:MAG: hypothetical protein KGJ28_16080 [Alphaproteobacteria bacterium]|nr:hypothetical protein [Alphaproteobacteria bacterium]
MADAPTHRNFGYAWLAFAIAVAVHVTDEATHDFLATYNPTVRAIRAHLPFLPIPTFTFPVWLGGLIAGIALLLCLTPLAFRGNARLRLVGLPLAIIVGVLNSFGHIGSSIYLGRWMPGVYSAPLLLGAAIWLLFATGRLKPHGGSVARA